MVARESFAGGIRVFADADSRARANRFWITVRKGVNLAARGERYLAAWRETDGVEADGSLQLEREQLLLRGRTRQGEIVVASLPYTELTAVRIGRSAEETLRGRPAVVLERGGRPPLTIAPIGAGLISELADLLATLAPDRADVAEQVAVIVPLRRGAREQARALVERGPPFDLGASGLARHRVFLSEGEAVFVFEGREVRRTVERLLGDASFLGAGLAWRGVLAGRPRLAESAYAWAAEDAADGSRSTG